MDDKDEVIVSKRPEDSAFNQQRLPALQPIITLNGLISIYFGVALLFIPLGWYLIHQSGKVRDFRVIYDGTESQMDVPCSISESNVGTNCNITIEFERHVDGPVYVYYELTKYYQNHMRYVNSRSADQLMGQNLDYDEVYSDCFPLVENSSILLNPCGLIANSLFNDVIVLQSSNQSGIVMETTGIAWPDDVSTKFDQVDGFTSAVVTNSSESCEEVLGEGYSDCKTYVDTSDGNETTYYFWYPDDDNVQYLYESFSNVVNPIEGVKNEHFIVWMRTAGLPNFRKLYGILPYDFKAGESLTFSITCNFEVSSFGGTKSLVLTTLAEFGAKNYALGTSFVVAGAVSLCIGILFALKRTIKPRPLGDIRQLGWES